VFTPPSLAAEIDRAEGRLVAELAERAGIRRPEHRSVVLPMAGGVAAYAAPGSPTNKVIGIGFDGPLHGAELELVERAWRDRDEPVRIELSTLADPTVAPWLNDRGYRLRGFENELGCRLDAIDPPGPGAGLTIETLASADHDAWLNVTIDGFAQADEGTIPESYPRDLLVDAFSDIAATNGFVRYLARMNGEPAGAASLRIDRHIAQLCGAATLAAFRRRGIQSTLLRRRLADARAAGCTVAVVTTQPGTRSQENSQRSGFALLYARAILVREWAGT
jgi:GNAT superfamily N-acetyltransferase